MTPRQMAALAVNEHGAMQKPDELARFLAFLRERSVHNVLEIGGNFGGTMWAWSQVATGKLICVDAQVLEGRMELADCDYHLIVGDSGLEDTRDRVLAALGDELVDLLFIDGDHTIAAVTRDYELYAPLVREGGVIGIHDTRHRLIADIDMPAFWRIASSDHESFEIFDRRKNWGGIGVLLP